MTDQGWLRGRRAVLEEWLDQRGLSSYLSANRYLLHRQLDRAFSQYVQGRVLEAGAGGSPFRCQLESLASEVVTLDVHDRYGDIDIVADVQDMAAIADDEFDVVVCTQVLEHLPRPLDAMKEMARVLKDGGVVLLSAPHLSMVHEAPEDYYRYTRYALQRMAEDAGLEVESIEPTGGLVAFISHPVSVGLMSVFGTIPLIRWLVWGINYVMLVWLVVLLDRPLGARSLFPLDNVLVARRASGLKQ